MRIPEETYALIKEKTANGEKYLQWFEVDIIDEEGDVVAPCAPPGLLPAQAHVNTASVH